MKLHELISDPDTKRERRVDTEIKVGDRTVHIMIVEDEESGQVARMSIGPDGHLGCVER